MHGVNNSQRAAPQAVLAEAVLLLESETALAQS